MRSWATFLSLFVATGFAAAGAASGGCSGEDNNATLAGSSVTVGPGGGHDNTFGCHGDGPDGQCTIRGGNPEACTCPDCEQSATCRGTCADDGQCSYVDGAPTNDEDCTCNDCYGKVAICPPYPSGCPDTPEGEPAVCSADEDCTCPDCSGTPRCTDNCFNNGSCVEYYEGCSCADCANDPNSKCNGGTTTTTSSSVSSSSAGGAGGSGSGSGGAGGA